MWQKKKDLFRYLSCYTQKNLGTLKELYDYEARVQNYEAGHKEYKSYLVTRKQRWNWTYWQKVFWNREKKKILDYIEECEVQTTA